jgi:hypothetical protein
LICVAVVEVAELGVGAGGPTPERGQAASLQLKQHVQRYDNLAFIVKLCFEDISTARRHAHAPVQPRILRPVMMNDPSPASTTIGESDAHRGQLGLGPVGLGSFGFAFELLAGSPELLVPVSLASGSDTRALTASGAMCAARHFRNQTATCVFIKRESGNGTLL